MPASDRLNRLSALARPSGAFAMLALDQRESLRTMLAAAPSRSATADGSSVAERPGPVPDDALATFKIEAARALTSAASAVLLDVDTGVGPVRDAGAIAAGCGLIVAADRLTQAPGGPVEWTEVDERVLDDESIQRIADAYKLLVIWRPGEEAERERVVRSFVAACRRLERPAIVEGIARPAGAGAGTGDASLGPAAHADLVVEAARELAGLGADLYKGEVPTLGAADDGTIAAAAERVTAAIDCPWVVLSNGTPADRFDTAMLAACRGGADGFLAGRAIWTASIAAPDRVHHLETVAAPRLAALAAAVDEVVGGRGATR